MDNTTHTFGPWIAEVKRLTGMGTKAWKSFYDMGLTPEEVAIVVEMFDKTIDEMVVEGKVIRGVNEQGQETITLVESQDN